jgi:hypothetical protein
MLRRVLIVTAMVGLLASPAFAQARGEISASVGWIFSDGVPFDGIPINGVIYNRVDPADSVGFSFTGGVFFSEQGELEFLWRRQPTTLDVTGPGAKLSGDMNVDTYHGNFVYNAGYADAVMRPFLFLGFGATNYGDAQFPGATVDGLTKFSWAFGGGVKAYPSEHVGIKATLSWTPTYIKSDSYGWWCDPYFGCAVVADPDYANQFEFSGGLLVRF